MTLTHIAIGFMEGGITVGVLFVLMKKNYKLEVLDIKEEIYEK